MGVIAGLDPAILPFAKRMDPRVTDQWWIDIIGTCSNCHNGNASRIAGAPMNRDFVIKGRFGARVGAFWLAATLLAGFAGSAAAQDKNMTIKLATATLNDVQHEWMKRFAVAIEKNSNGRVKAELYPASQLGTIPRMVESTQLGSIQIWLGPPEFLVGVDPRF
jgi:hypothetical protein